MKMYILERIWCIMSGVIFSKSLEGKGGAKLDNLIEKCQVI